MGGPQPLGSQLLGRPASARGRVVTVERSDGPHRGGALWVRRAGTETRRGLATMSAAGRRSQNVGKPGAACEIPRSLLAPRAQSPPGGLRPCPRSCGRGACPTAVSGDALWTLSSFEVPGARPQPSGPWASRPARRPSPALSCPRAARPSARHAEHRPRRAVSPALCSRSSLGGLTPVHYATHDHVHTCTLSPQSLPSVTAP